MHRCNDLSAKDKNTQGGWEGVMLCRVEVKSEQMSLESFAEDGK